MKTCSKCGEEKPEADFYARRNACKACVCAKAKRYYAENRDACSARTKRYYAENREVAAAYAKQYRQDNPELIAELKNRWADRNPDKLRAYRLMRDYGMTLVDYEDLLMAQGGCCALCAKPPGKKRLAVDHCHATGKVRGLLCPACNGALGRFGDNTDGVRRVLAYLERG